MSSRRWAVYFRSKRSRFITFVQAATKSFTNFCLRIRCWHRPRPARAARSSSRTPGPRACRSTSARRSCGRVLRTIDASEPASTPCPCRAGSRRSRWSACPRLFVNTPCFEPPVLAPSTRSPPTSTVISGAVSVSSCALSTSRCSASASSTCPSGSCGSRRPSGSRKLNDSTSVCACEASLRPGVNGTFTLTPAFFAAFSMPAPPAEHDQVGQRHLLAARGRLVEVELDALEHLEHLRQLRRLVHFPVLLRRQPDARAIGATAFVAAAERGGRGPGRRDQLAPRESLEASDLFLQRARISLVIDERVVDLRGSGPARSALPSALRGRDSARAAPCRDA